MKSHSEDGSGVEEAAAISTVDGRARRSGDRSAFWVRIAGELVTTEVVALGLREESLVNGDGVYSAMLISANTT